MKLVSITALLLVVTAVADIASYVLCQTTDPDCSGCGTLFGFRCDLSYTQFDGFGTSVDGACFNTKDGVEWGDAQYEGGGLLLTIDGKSCAQSNNMLSAILFERWESWSEGREDPAPFCDCEASLYPTRAPTSPTNSPTTGSPSNYPTGDPTSHPTSDPTMDPTSDPTSDPTRDPTSHPTSDPTQEPTVEPTSLPSANPSTLGPSTEPTMDPTDTLSEDGDSGNAATIPGLSASTLAVFTMAAILLP